MVTVAGKGAPAPVASHIPVSSGEVDPGSASTGVAGTRTPGSPVPTVRAAGVIAVASVLVAFVPAPPLDAAAFLGALVAAGLVADWLSIPAPSKFAVTRSHPRALQIGEKARVEWTVSNPASRRVIVRLADDLAPSLGAASRRASLSVEPKRRASSGVELRPARRGHFPIPGLTIRVVGAIGLVARQSYRVLPSDLAVHPSLARARTADLWARRHRATETGLRAVRLRGSGTEFDALREYTVDDEYRRVDWAASARVAKPIVRTYRAEVDQRVLCLVDAGRTMSGTVEGIPRFEHALDGLLMLTALATRLGDRCGLVVFDSSVRAVVPAERRAGQLGRVSDAVYRVHPGLVESDYRGAFSYALRRFPSRSLIVLFSELAESAVDEALVPALALVGRRHAVTVASVSDPKVEGWSQSSPDSVDAAYRKAAARWTVGRRHSTAARLASMGVTVVDAPPDRLATAVAGAYLAAKASGRI